MSKPQRIVVEAFAPPLLATLYLFCFPPAGWKPEPISTQLLAFLPMLFFAYLFAIIPSCLYAAVMELWFRLRLRTRFGLFCTVALSSFLGAGGGFLACAIGTWLGPLIGEDFREYVRNGVVVGLLVGFYVGSPWTAGERHEPQRVYGPGSSLKKARSRPY